MKLIINLPEKTIQRIRSDYGHGIKGIRFEDKDIIVDAIWNGTPLDDVKAEIAEEICLTNNPYTKETKYTIEHLKLLDILDNIGKDKGGE